MSVQTTISHLGFVDSVENNMATIKINSQSACAACHAKGACTAADQEEKILTVSVGNQTVNIGEQVRVHISKRTGLNAVAIGYIYPFLVLMTILIVLTVLGVSELKAGLWALISLPPYYLGIYLFRDKLDKAFTFKLEKLNFDV